MSTDKTPESVTQRFREIKQEIASKAFSDGDFRDRLLADPNTTIASEYGLPAPALSNMNIKIIEEQPGVLTIPVPPSMDELELSDEQLEQVSGGTDPFLIGLTIATVWATAVVTVAAVDEISETSW